MTERYVQTIFCDDIRHEINGKTSFIGVYSGDLFVKTFPVILPKLCLAVKVITPSSDPIQRMTLRVLKNKETIQEVDVSEQQLREVSQIYENDSVDKDGFQVQVSHFFLVFSPFQLDDPCTLRVPVITEAGELRGVGLRVKQAPTEQDEAAKK